MGGVPHGVPHSGRLLLRLLTVLLVIAVGWGAARSLDNMYNDATYARADYRGLAERIAADNIPMPVSFSTRPISGKCLPITIAMVHLSTHCRVAIPIRSQRGSELRGIVTMHDRLYVLYWGEHQRDPDGLVERAQCQHVSGQQ